MNSSSFTGPRPRGAVNRGAVNPLVLAAAASALFVGLLILLLPGHRFSGPHANGDAEELFLYCAAGMRLPVEEILDMYHHDCGIRVRCQYGGSNTLLSQIEVGRMGDLYLAADESYLRRGTTMGLVAEHIPLARMSAVIAVPSGNPGNIQSVADLSRDDVRVAMGNPDQAAVGKVVRAALRESGQWASLEANVRAHGVFKPTVGDVANDVKLGSVDAGVIWDSVAAQYTDIEMINSEDVILGTVDIALGVLTDSNQPTRALHFARYLSARDRGLRVFERLGYVPVGGDQWEDSPQLTFYSGAINRHALESTLDSFAAREGVRVNTVYNGCGILTAQMRSIVRDESGDFPDAFMACDRHYLDAVNELFEDRVDVSSARIVILTARGNPKQINQLRDLAKPGVRVALGQPKQCTIGVLSKRLLESVGLYEQITSENLVTEMTSSSLLVPSITTGAADAVLAYETDAMAEQDHVEIVEIDSPLAQAIQPFGIARSSAHKQLGKRLLDAISMSRSQFESAGFSWRLDNPHWGQGDEAGVGIGSSEE